MPNTLCEYNGGLACRHGIMMLRTNCLKIEKIIQFLQKKNQNTKKKGNFYYVASGTIRQHTRDKNTRKENESDTTCKRKTTS